MKNSSTDKLNDISNTNINDNLNLKNNNKYPIRIPTQFKNSENTENFISIFTIENIITIKGKEYLKIDTIYKGKGSEILKVLDENGDFYALKKIIFSQKDINTKENYINEIRFLEGFQNCDRIIQIVDSEIILNERIIYILLELGDIDLSKVISKQEFVKPNFLRHTWQQMLEAVQVLHSNRIIHGHLKPSNFLYVKGTLKLIDLGIAKVIDENSTSTIFESPEIFKYQPPESTNYLSGQKAKMNCSADVWSLGCILFELVYNRTLTSFEISRMGDKCNLKFPSIEGRPDMDLIIDIMRECLHKNPKYRPSIEDLLNHPYVSCASVFFLDRGLSLKDNFSQLVKQIQDEYSDSEFNCPQGKLVIQNLTRQLLSGRPMKINAR